MLDILKSIEELGDKNAVSIAREHFLDAYNQEDVAELHAYPQRVKVKIRSKDQELFVAGRRMQVLRQQQETSDRNYQNKYSEFDEQYPRNTILEKYLYCEQEEKRVALILSYLGDITKEQEARLVDLFRLKRVRDKTSQDYSESYAHYQASKSELLKLTTQYEQAFPDHRIALTSQSIIDEEDRKRALELALMEAEKAAMLAQMEAAKVAAEVEMLVQMMAAEEAVELAVKEDKGSPVYWNPEHDDVSAVGQTNKEVIDLLANLELSPERQDALDALYAVFMRQDEIEGSDSDIAKNEYEMKKAEFYQQYFLSEEEQERTATKLIDLEQKIQHLKDAYNTASELLANAGFEVITEEQELAITRNGWSLSFLRNLYEAHYEVLKGYLDSIAISAANAATAESSDDEWAASALVDEGVMAELNVISQAHLDLTDDQQTVMAELCDITMHCAA